MSLLSRKNDLRENGFQVDPAPKALDTPSRVPKLGLYLIKLHLQMGVKSSFIHFKYGINMLPIYSQAFCRPRLDGYA